MSFDWLQHLSDASDAQVQDALQHAHIPALLAALVHLTGNTDHFEEIRPLFELFAEEEDGLDEVQREKARSKAWQALQQYRTEGCPELNAPPESAIEVTMDAITGNVISGDMREFLREELNLFGEDRRKLDIDTQEMPEDFQVTIIGAGMSGIAIAIRLQQQGIPFQILEKNPEIGGTWYENTYPGCQVDSSNHVYNYLFEPHHQWPRHFSGAADLFAYFEGVVDKYNLRPRIRLGTEVLEARWDPSSHSWQLQVQHQGSTNIIQTAVLVSAVGQLNIPRLPDLPGIEDFGGIAFHSARWEHQHDLQNKRVAVIGTGCSAAQFVPEIAANCASLTIFQRTPPWLFPAPTYHEALTEQELWLFREIPFYARWYRFFVFRTRGADGWLPMMYTQENWDGPPGTISEGNEMLRAALVESLTEQAAGDGELLAKLIPDYPPGGKRPILDDGSWITTLKRDNVELCTDNIAAITEAGLEMNDGSSRDFDVLIYGTGFHANRFLHPMKIVGRNDRELVSDWGGNPRAYLGTVVPEFPNYYCLYGPNTNIVTGSSIVFVVECQVRYVMSCLKHQLEDERQSLECREDVMEDYLAEIDRLNQQRAWGADSVSSWYKNTDGRVTQNWPGTHFQWWLSTRGLRDTDFLEAR